jgi:hypothetical protein
VKGNLKNTVLRLEAYKSCTEQERLSSNVALVITRKVKEADTKWEHILRRLWEMGKQIAVKSEGNKLVREYSQLQNKAGNVRIT